MQKQTLLLLFLLFSISSLAQSIAITTDSRGNQQYLSEGDSYRATLSKDIFDKLIYTDNQGNKISRSKEYLQLKHPSAVNNPSGERIFFEEMINTFRYVNDYVASYSVDIFDNISFTENKPLRPQYPEAHPEGHYPTPSTNYHIDRNRDGSYSFQTRRRREEALLKIGFSNCWVYTDSKGNELKFSGASWEDLMCTYGNPENLFLFLIDSFLMNHESHHFTPNYTPRHDRSNAQPNRGL